MHRMLYIVKVAKQKRALALREARLPADLARSAFQHVDEGEEEDTAKQFSDLQSMLCESQGCGDGAKQKDPSAAPEETIKDTSCNGLFPIATS